MGGSATPAHSASEYAQVAGVNVKAILSLPLSVGFCVLGVVFAHLARNEIRRSGERGDGLAKAALIIGYPVLCLWTAFWVVLIVAAFVTM